MAPLLTWTQFRNTGNRAAQQQHSPQLHHKQSQQPSPSSSSPKNGRTKAKMTSIRRMMGHWYYFWFVLGGLALFFLTGIIVLSVWNPEGQENQKVTNKFIRTINRDRQQQQQQRQLIKTPFDGKQNNAIQQQILSFLHDSSISNRMDANLQSWDWPLVHIVNTRFMQEQGHLKALGRARLYLFRTFCLPTMIHQSTQQFLWIIKTDPNLDLDLLQDLIQDLQPHPNIYLVASNVNFMIRDNHQQVHHSWRDGAEIHDILQSTIYTGNPIRLYQAMLQKDLQVVLETRLDADDGLHKFYLQQIQEKALDQFGILPPEEGEEEEEEEEEEEYIPPRWLYWCTRRHVEWHGGMQLTHSFITLNNTLVKSAQSPDYYGSLLVVEHSKLCITPGITVGFGIGTPSEDVPIHAHDKLFKAIHALKPEDACGYTKVSDCLELVEDMLLVAVRARTPTSAGMQRVMGTDITSSSTTTDDFDNSTTTTKTQKKKEPQPPQPSPLKMYLYWDLLHDDFFLLREQIQYTNRYILDHLVPIAKDNLEGQCTSDHSCKKETKEKLLKIIEDNKQQEIRF